MNNSYVQAQQKRRNFIAQNSASTFSGSRHGFHAAVIPLVLFLAPVTDVGPEPHSTTAATTNHWFAPPRGVYCLSSFLYSACDEYTVLHCSSTVPQDSRSSNSVVVLQNHIAEALFPSSFSCAEFKLDSAPLFFSKDKGASGP